MFPGCPEHDNTQGTLSEYSRNIACRPGNACTCRQICACVDLRAGTYAWNHFSCTKSTHANFKFVESWFICSFSISLITPSGLLVVYMVEQIFRERFQDLILKTYLTYCGNDPWFILEVITQPLCQSYDMMMSMLTSTEPT